MSDAQRPDAFANEDNARDVTDENARPAKNAPSPLDIPGLDLDLTVTDIIAGVRESRER